MTFVEIYFTLTITVIIRQWQKLFAQHFVAVSKCTKWQDFACQVEQLQHKNQDETDTNFRFNKEWH